MGFLEYVYASNNLKPCDLPPGWLAGYIASPGVTDSTTVYARNATDAGIVKQHIKSYNSVLRDMQPETQHIHIDTHNNIACSVPQFENVNFSFCVSLKCTQDTKLRQLATGSSCCVCVTCPMLQVKHSVLMSLKHKHT